MSCSFSEYYNNVLRDINNDISNYDRGLLKCKNECLLENLKYFCDLNECGKRIRGVLITLGYKIATQKSDVSYSYPLSLAYEIAETAILVHDDIIDNDNIRRGVNTVHYSNYLNYKKYDEEKAKDVSSSLAICMGDYGFFLANVVISDYYKDDINFSKILSYYSDIILKTIEGQTIDVKQSFISKYNNDITSLNDNVMQIYKYKTAYYSIIGPLCLGLILGNVSQEKIDEISIPLEKIGIAYQVQDDILGIYNDMGKVIGSDIKEFKQTILFSYVMENETYKDELLKYYGNDEISISSVENVRRIFKESGAYDYAYNYMNNLFDESINGIKEIEWIDDENKELLVEFVNFLRKRQK